MQIVKSLKFPCRPGSTLPLAIWCDSAINDLRRSSMSRAYFENKPLRWLSIFSPNDSGHLAVTHSVTAPWAAVQPGFIFLQKFAFCAIGDPLQSSTACLGCRFVCTTSGFAQKKDARPVGGRGISAFSHSFLSSRLTFQAAAMLHHAQTLSGNAAQGSNQRKAVHIHSMFKNTLYSHQPACHS